MGGGGPEAPERQGTPPEDKGKRCAGGQADAVAAAKTKAGRERARRERLNERRAHFFLQTPQHVTLTAPASAWVSVACMRSFHDRQLSAHLRSAVDRFRVSMCCLSCLRQVL